jgi:carbonic anhydrase
MQPIGSYGWAYGLPNPREHDKFKSDYANIATDTLIKWDYSSLKFDITVEFEMEEEEKIYNMFFDSQYAKKLYDAKTSKFIPSHVVFKSPSEHTINGHHLDLEMQVYHKAKGWEEGDDIKYGVMAVFFSVEEFDKSIDEASNKTMQDFFRQLKFEDHEDKIAPSLLIGDVMNALEYEDRWTYKGSVSEPPCEQYVYWNLLRTVYPIEIDRFAFFSDFMYSKKKYLGGYKNNRKINTVEDHYVQYIGAHFISATKALTIVSATILAYVTLY